MLAVLLLHTEKISALSCFLMTKEVGNEGCDVSNAILYELLFFSGVPDCDSGKLCYSRSQMFFIYFHRWVTVEIICVHRRLSVTTVGFMED